MKESLEFIRHYKELCQKYPNFEENFMIFFEDKILDYQRKLLTAEELDLKIIDYIDFFIRKERNKKLKSILRKKD
jgi:hypothetical protein